MKISGYKDGLRDKPPIDSPFIKEHSTDIK